MLERPRQEEPGGQMGLAFPAREGEGRRIWTVAQLVGEIRGRIERDYPDIWVEGEISNCRAAPSGHIYFTLKDGEAQLSIVLFRRQAALLRFRPEDGLQILVRGRLSVYEQRGQMQMVAEFAEPVGAGSLQIAFEQLKAKLQQEGLFGAERKKPLPAFPKCIGIVTSPTGAVIRDFLNVAGRRHLALQVEIYPALVQGETAAQEVAAGIEYFNRSRSVDVIVIARGGGSLEDLAPFNSESLARAISRSELPVVSAVGHETDFTISDFVADLRAPTPSAAAELITEAQHKVEERLAELHRRLTQVCRYLLMQANDRLSRVSAPAAFARIRDLIARRQQRLDELQYQIETAWRNRVLRWAENWRGLEVRLLRRDVSHRMRVVRERLTALDVRLGRGEWERLCRLRASLTGTEALLTSLSPLAVLNRGYALVFDSSGALLKDAAAIRQGERLETRLARGRIASRVIETQPEDTQKVEEQE